MKGVKILLAISGALAVLVSSALMLAPGSFLGSQGFATEGPITLVAQAQGSLLIAVGVLNLMALRLRDPGALRPILAANLVTHVAALGVNVHGILSKLAGPQVFGDVVMHVLLGAFFTYFLVRAPAATA
jgi:hypothetical protein